MFQANKHFEKNKFSDKDNLIKLGLDSIGFMQCLYIFQKWFKL